MKLETIRIILFVVVALGLVGDIYNASLESRIALGIVVLCGIGIVVTEIILFKKRKKTTTGNAIKPKGEIQNG